MGNVQKKCIVCRDMLYRGKSPVKLKQKKADWGLTCSPNCSTIYNDVARHIRAKERYERNKLK